MNRFTALSTTLAATTRRMVPVLAAILTLSLPAWSQSPHSGRAEEMVKLDFLLGEWKGKGWVVHWDGSRGDEFSQKTKVQAKADGSALRFKDDRNYNTPGVIHTSTTDATIYYDEVAKIYRWRGENSYGRQNPLEANLVDVRTFQYGVPFTVSVPLRNGARRTTIQVTEGGEWHETLEFLMSDGWFKAEETVLKRSK